MARSKPLRSRSRGLQREVYKPLDKNIIVAVLSLLIGSATGWGTSELAKESRLSRLETKVEDLLSLVQEVRQDVKEMQRGIILVPIAPEKNGYLQDPSQSDPGRNRVHPYPNPLAYRCEK